jgi:hypothetical protein
VSELPTGTVTFLFTDLEGSTRLCQDHPEAIKDARASVGRMADQVCRASPTYFRRDARRSGSTTAGLASLPREKRVHREERSTERAVCSGMMSSNEPLRGWRGMALNGVTAYALAELNWLAANE